MLVKAAAALWAQTTWWMPNEKSQQGKENVQYKDAILVEDLKKLSVKWIVEEAVEGSLVQLTVLPLPRMNKGSGM